MLSKQELDAALAAERAMYRALSEVQDITRELLDAVDRQDQVSVRLFLSMRQEQINQLRDQKELLKKQCGGLPKEEGDLLRQILSGKKPAGVEGEALSLQVERNRALLERTLQADKALSGWRGESLFTKAESGRCLVEKSPLPASCRQRELDVILGWRSARAAHRKSGFGIAPQGSLPGPTRPGCAPGCLDQPPGFSHPA